MGWNPLKKAKKALKKVGKSLKKVWDGAKKVFKKIVKSKIFWAVVIVAAAYFTYGYYAAGQIGANATAGSAVNAGVSTGVAEGGAAAAGGAAAGGATEAAASGFSFQAPALPAAGGQVAAPTVANIGAQTAAQGIGTTVVEQGASQGILGSLANFGKGALTFVNNNPWPTLMGTQMAGSMLQAKAATDAEEEALDRYNKNMNIRGVGGRFLTPKPTSEVESTIAPSDPTEGLSQSPSSDRGNVLAASQPTSRIDERMARGVV